MTATTTLPVLFATGIHASRPSASAVGAGGLYSCTTHSLVYQTDGVSTWSTWATLTGTGLSDPMTTRGDIIVRNSSNATARLAIGSSGKVLSSDGTDISWQTPSGSSSGPPTVVQAMTSGSGNTALTLTLDAAPTSGNVLVLGSFSNGSAGLSTVVCTNVTWTKMVTGTAVTSTKMEIWIGKVSGAGGTTVTITRAGGNAIWTVLEITGVSVTPTAGNTLDFTQTSWKTLGGMASTTTGHLVVVAAGAVNQNAAVALSATIPLNGLPIGVMVAVGVGYATGNRLYAGAHSTDTSGGGIIGCEVT